MRSGESPAHLFGLVEEVFVFLLQTLRLCLANRLRALIGEYLIVLLQDEIDVPLEFLVESFEVV